MDAQTLQNKPPLASADLTQAAFAPWQSPHYETVMGRVSHRLIRQLLQALLFEQIVDYTVVAAESGVNSNEVAESSRKVGFKIPIQDGYYLADGQIHDSFGLIRLDSTPIYKVIKGEGLGTNKATLEGVIADILMPLTGAKLKDNFIKELRQTWINDIQAQALTPNAPAVIDELSYEQLESHLMAGHPYHPCYKSRLGFSLVDNYRFGPEFAQDIQVYWLAVDDRLVVSHALDHLDINNWVAEYLGPSNYELLLARLEALIPQEENDRHESQLSSSHYVFIPVHPWQWQHTLISALQPLIASNEVIYLGDVGSPYRAQQSIRSLTHKDNPAKAYLKLSMHLTNTSSTRILAKHTVLNAATVTRWLKECIKDDPEAKALRFEFLGENVGVSLDHDRLYNRGLTHASLYGGLGAIWRDSVHQYLTGAEQAFPLNGISEIQADGSKLIDPWIERYGLTQWVTQLIKVCVTPLIHMLFAHGIALESHAQNIVLVHEKGYPVRLLLKDLHDGVRYSPKHLANPAAAPKLVSLPAAHAELNRGSFIETEDTDGVRDFSVACLFFVAMSDIAIFLQQHYDLQEGQFWQYVADCIQAYQAAHPQYQERYELFDVFAAQTRIESLAKRRLFGDSQFPIKYIDNPLHRAAAGLTK